MQDNRQKDKINSGAAGGMAMSFVSGSRNKVYAFVSVSLILLIAVSFAATVSFLLKIDGLIFGTDQKIIKEKNTTLDKQGFEKIKVKLEGIAGK